MYVAVKGGEAAIDQSVRLVAQARRGDAAVPELTLEQIKQQLRLSVNRVMTEGSVYDQDLAALAIKQAAGDLVEAIFSCARSAPRCRGWATRRPWTPRRCACSGASRPFSRTCRAGRCWGRRSTIRSACSISRSWRRKKSGGQTLFSKSRK